MSDNEVEQFEVTDYDIQNEFNINRPRRRLTKNQQIYGIWADDSGGEDDSSSRRPQFQGVSKKKQSYSTPVSFIAGGVQQAGKKKDEEIKDKKASGAAEAPMDEDEEAEDSGPMGGSSSEEEMPRAGFGQQKQKGGYGKRRPLAQSKLNEIDSEIAGMRRKMPGTSSVQLMQKGVGDWERHTKGIGAKLLLQMGFQPGRGLGRNLQGIQAPVEAAVRKGRGAIGAYGPERRQRLADQADSEDEEAKEFTEKLSQWRKGDAAPKKQKVRYVYKTIDQVLEEGKAKPSSSIKDFSNLSKVKVIDMTGPEQRVLSGYHAIAGQQRPSDEWDSRKDRDFRNFDLPELLHNLDLLVTMCEQEIVDCDRRLRHGQDRTIVLEQETESLGNLVQSQAAQVDATEAVLGLIEQLNEKPLTLEKAVFCVQELQEKHKTEYQLYEMGIMTANLVAPLIKEQLKDWKPLDCPTAAGPLEEFQRWQRLLEGERSHTLSSAAAKDPYHTLVWEAWMPSIRIAVITWNCRKSGPLVSLLDAWRGVVPSWILGSVMDQMVLPRLGQEVELWDPLTDTVPVHEWLHPWIPYAKESLSISIYPVIRRKLSAALTAWHPSDRSAHLMLKPWQNAFSRGELDAFLLTNILPKLQTTMQELVINPHQQHLDQWKWVMEWEDMLPVHTMASLLDKCFFPKWLQVLTMWLTHAPNYDEIGNWYRGWKSMLSETLLAHPSVKAKLRDALQLMNQAAMATKQNQSMAFLVAPPPPPPPPPPGVPVRDTHQELMAEAVRTASQIPQGFRELLQKRCEERGILFVPIPNRWHEAKQVYRCGRVQVYLDRNVIFVCRNNTNIWSPSNLQAVLDMAV